MIPKSFSATALQIAQQCLARYIVEVYKQGGKALPNNSAADLGLVIHSTLELYVKSVYIEKNHEPDLTYLLEFFKMCFMSSIGFTVSDSEDYTDGIDMLKRWFKRTDFEGVEVLSCEVKSNFPIKAPNGSEIPFNYIWDRLDKIGPNEYRVVDYKTIRFGIRSDDLLNKLQARIYGLAAQIQFPNAQKIWIEFDTLRHQSSVGIVFSREENIATWKFIKNLIQKIYDTPGDLDLEEVETINPECRYCIRKISCKALQSNITAGGVFGITAHDAVDTRAMLQWQLKGIEASIAELDKIILTEAKQSDIQEYESETNKLRISISSRRNADAEFVERIIGSDLFDKYGGRSITITNIDKLLKGSELNEAQKKQLRSIIYYKNGEPSVKVETKNPIDGD